ncbi:MAG: S8 family serine peptidase [Marinifilaceae bacterium]
MNNLSKYIFLLPFLGLGVSCSESLNYSENKEITIQGQNQDLMVVPGIIRVKFNKNVDINSIVQNSRTISRTGIAQLDETLNAYNIKSIKPFFPSNANYKEAEQRHGLDRWFEIELLETKSGQLQDETVSLLSKCRLASIVDIAEGAYATVSYGAAASTITTSYAMASNAIMSDPLLGKQWHYDMGQLDIMPEANISLFKAWEYTKGDPSVIVAVNDSGIDVEHEDLVDNIWINYAELNGESFSDDDDNGYIDDIYGYNFMTGTGRCDKGEHGTHVAGTIAASNNNGKGVCGIAGGSGKKDGVRLMSCQIMSAQGASAVGGNAAKALKYSAEMGAVISQNSWGYGAPDIKEQVLLDAIDYFIAEAGSFPGSLMKGGIVITSSGNMGSGANYYPGAYKPCFTVSSTDYRNKKSSFSNFGEYVDLCAPGGSDTQSTNPHNILSTLPDNEYGYMAGTSMACPHVSGIAALLISRFGGNNFTSDDLKSLLIESCLDLSKTEPTYSLYLGQGLVNAEQAMKIGSNNEQHIAPNPVSDLEYEINKDNQVKLKWSVTSDEDHGTPSKYKVYYNNAPISVTEKIPSEDVILYSPVVGQKIEYILNNVSQLDSCFVVVTGVDRAGNESKLSNQVSFKLKPINTQLTAIPSNVKKATTVSWGSDHSGKTYIEVFSVSGKRVYQKEVQSESFSCTVDLSFLAPGQYTLQLRSETKTAKTQILKY